MIFGPIYLLENMWGRCWPVSTRSPKQRSTIFPFFRYICIEREREEEPVLWIGANTPNALMIQGSVDQIIIGLCIQMFQESSREKWDNGTKSSSGRDLNQRRCLCWVVRWVGHKWNFFWGWTKFPEKELHNPKPLICKWVAFLSQKSPQDLRSWSETLKLTDSGTRPYGQPFWPH